VNKVKNKIKPEKQTVKIEPQVAPPSWNGVPVKEEEPSTSQDPAAGEDIQLHMDSEGFCVVYTDGSCLSNGREGAKAGVGVWFGENSSL